MSQGPFNVPSGAAEHTEAGKITHVLSEDHRRLHALLIRAREGDRDAYDEFRGGLLRHIGIEEKIVLPALRACGHEPVCAKQLHLDHSAIAAMLVPSPSPELLTEIEALLTLHDPLEEGEGGLYRVADAQLADIAAILDRIAAAPVPPLAPNFDGPRAFAAIELLLTRAREARAPTAQQ